MPKNTVKVCIRTRPTSNIAKELININTETREISVHMSKKKGNTAQDYINHQAEDWAFKFDSVLHNASQEAVFEECARDMTHSVLEGYNGTIMAYGQTGAGKTFTMTGGNDSFKYRGIIPRVLGQMFEEIADKPQTNFKIQVSYLEIYCDLMYDLLVSDDDARSNLQIVEDDRGAIVVKGLSKRVIQNEEDGLNVLFEGDTRRMVAEHQYNKNSSRSHCIFTIHVEASSRVESNDVITKSKINLVDLAGSERVKKSKSEGETLKEAMSINKTLTFLEQVVISLANKQKRDHVPYRQSRLTNLLKDTLGGNAKMFLVANIFVEALHIEETVSTLKFAQRMMAVEQDATVNVTEDNEAKIKKYERTIAELRSELAMHDAIVNRSHVAYDPYTEEQRLELQKEIKAFLKGEIADIPVTSLRHVREVFLGFRQLISQLQAELDSSRRSQGIATPIDGAVSSAQTTGAMAQADDATKGEVGELESSGFGVGIAPASAKPKAIAGAVTRPKATPKAKETKQKVPVKAPSPIQSPEKDANDTTEPTVPDSPVELAEEEDEEPMPQYRTREEAFEDFKTLPTLPGYDTNLQLLQAKAELKEKKKQLRDKAADANSQKREIDSIKALLERKKTERLNTPSMHSTDDEVIIDEEEYENIKKLKVTKRVYRELYEQVSKARQDMEYAQKLVDQIRIRLVEEFDAWYAVAYPARLNGRPDESVASYSARSNSHMGDVMDYGEQFDRMELQRIIDEDPDSAAFYNARKQVKSKPLSTRTLREKKALRQTFR